MVNEHNVDYHPCPLELTSRIHYEFSLKPVYATIIGKSFQIYSVQMENVFASQ